MEQFSSVSNLIEVGPRFESPSFLNLISSIFNLMNAVIGAGIIGLAYVASVLGYIQFMFWIALVLIISVFTMDLVCNLSQWAGCYQAIQNQAKTSKMMNPTDFEVCDGECLKHKRIYSYEAIGNLLYGGIIKYFINCIILFYLMIAITTYFIIIKKNLPTIVLFFLESYGITHVTDKWYLNGDYLLGLMVICVHIPLGMLKKIDFLGFTSFIGMACMSTFVFMVIKKQPEAALMCGNITFAEAEPVQECIAHKFIINENTIYAIPMLLFSFMCHGNILSIVAELKSPTRRRMRQLIFGAAIPCTILYTLTALFGYFSYFNRTESMLLETYSLWLNGDAMVAVSNIMVTICIMFSVPILHYPCRFSLWNLLHQMIPRFVPAAFDNGDPSTFNRGWYSLFCLLLHVGIYSLVVMTENFRLVLSLGGAISGSCIIQIFPAMYYLKIFNWRYNGLYNKCVWIILLLGIATFIGNTGLVIVQNVASQHDRLENQYHDKQNEDGYNLLAFGRTHNATMSHNNASFESTFGSDMEGSSAMFEASGGY